MSLVEKLGIKPGCKAAVLNAPPGYVDMLDLPEDIELHEKATKERCYFVQIFVNNLEEVKQLPCQILGLLEYNGVLWIAYPKSQGKTIRESIWDILFFDFTMDKTKTVSIDTTWSTVRYMPREQIRRRHKTGYNKELATFTNILVTHCVRNTCLEDIHSGIRLHSETGDYSDIKIVTPDGEIPWNEVSRISQKEMRLLMKSIMNKVYTLLYYHFIRGAGLPERPFYQSTTWDPPEIDKDFQHIFEKQLNAQNEQ